MIFEKFLGLQFYFWSNQQTWSHTDIQNINETLTIIKY